MKCIPLTFAISLLLCGNSLAAGNPLVQVQLLPADQTIVLGQPVIVVVQLQATVATTVDLGIDRTMFLKFLVSDPAGHRTEVHLDTPDLTMYPGPTSLEAGQPYRYPLNLYPALKADTIGTYNIAVEIDAAANPGITFERGQSADVTVKPRDEKQLRLACEDLVHRIQGTKMAAEQIELTPQLASIHDPACVPSMRTLLERPFALDYQVINALAAIGNADAVDAIRLSLSSHHPTTVTIATIALKNIQFNTKDEAVRQRACDALASVAPKPK